MELIDIINPGSVFSSKFLSDLGPVLAMIALLALW